MSPRDLALIGVGAGLGYALCKWLGKKASTRSGDKYEIVYHSKLSFRAAPIQMMLLDAGAEFTMTDPHWGTDRVVEANPGTPAFAPPALRVGDTTVAQTPAILHFLSERLGYHARSDSAEIGAAHLQLLLDIGDVTSELFAEVRKGAEAKAKFGSSEDGGRLRNWLEHLRKIYARRSGGRGFLFEPDRPMAADYFMLAAVESFEFCYGVQHMRALLPPEIATWRALMEERPFFRRYQQQAKPILFESMKYNAN